MVTEPTRWVDEAANISRHEAEFVSGASTIGELIGFDPIVRQAEPCEPPRLEGQPPFPAPGIYFGMPEEQYHAIHACSASGLKKMATSSMDYFASSVLNPDKEESDAPHFGLGKAYHKRIVEGREAYAAAYAIALDKAAYPAADLLVTVDQIKLRIIHHGEKPAGKRKEDWIAQLLDIEPDALIWDAMVERHADETAGKILIRAIDDRRIQIAARMIEAHPELREAFRGGFAEVSAFYYCPETGAPMKLRFDYLKMRAIVDLKSFSNQQGKPVNRAIETAIASMRYNVQHVVYDEAVPILRQMIQQQGDKAIACHPLMAAAEREATVAWVHRWAKQEQPPAFMFVFQQTGAAPVTRGRIMPRGTVFSVTRSRVRDLKQKWCECARTYGCLPWLDIEPVDTIEDEAIPIWATDI